MKECILDIGGWFRKAQPVPQWAASSLGDLAEKKYIQVQFSADCWYMYLKMKLGRDSMQKECSYHVQPEIQGSSLGSHLLSYLGKSLLSSLRSYIWNEPILLHLSWIVDILNHLWNTLWNSARQGIISSTKYDSCLCESSILLPKIVSEKWICTK